MRRKDLSRRSILRASLGLATALLQGPIGIVRPADAQVLEALTVLAIAANVIQSVSSAPDDALGASLRALHDKLDLIIGEFSKVEKALGELSAALARLPGQFMEIVQTERIKGNVATIQAALHQWREVLGDVGSKRGEELTDTQRHDLNHIRTRAWDARSMLSSNPEGESAIAASIALASLALEINTEVIISGRREGHLKGLLKSYVDWVGRIEDASRPSSAAAAEVTIISERADALKHAISADSIGGLFESYSDNPADLTADEVLPFGHPYAHIHYQSVCEKEAVSAQNVGPENRVAIASGLVKRKINAIPIFQVEYRAFPDFDIPGAVKTEEGGVLFADHPEYGCGWRTTRYVATLSPTPLEAQKRIFESGDVNSLKDIRSAVKSVDTLNNIEIRLFFVKTSREIARRAKAEAERMLQELS